MRRIISTVVALCLVSLGIAAENQASLDLIAQTSVQATAAKIAGGEANKTIFIRLWTPDKAPDDAKAELAIPQGLKLGEKVSLTIAKAQAERANMIAGIDLNANKDLIINRSFGSADTLKDEQRETVRWDALNDAQRVAVMARIQAALQRQQIAAKAEGTTAYWPEKQKRLEADAAIAGHYALTSFAGNIEFAVEEKIKFLAPIEMVTEKIDVAQAADQAMKVEWKAIEGVKAYHVTIIGIQGKNSLVIWEAADVKSDLDTDWASLDNARIDELLNAKAMLSGDQTQVTIPAGTIRGCDAAVLMITGYGEGMSATEQQPLPHVQTVTTLAVNLIAAKPAATIEAAPATEANTEIKQTTEAE